MVLLAAKIVFSAGFVLAITAAIERLLPRLGPLIAMVPQLAVLSLVFFAIEQGHAFAAETAFWNIPGMCATVPVLVGYLVASRLVPAPRWASITAGVALGTVCFLVPAYLLSVIPMPRWAVVPLAVAVCFGTGWIVRPCRTPPPAARGHRAAAPGHSSEHLGADRWPGSGSSGSGSRSSSAMRSPSPISP